MQWHAGRERRSNDNLRNTLKYNIASASTVCNTSTNTYNANVELSVLGRKIPAGHRHDDDYVTGFACVLGCDSFFGEVIYFSVP